MPIMKKTISGIIVECVRGLSRSPAHQSKDRVLAGVEVCGRCLASLRWGFVADVWDRGLWSVSGFIFATIKVAKSLIFFSMPVMRNF